MLKDKMIRFHGRRIQSARALKYPADIPDGFSIPEGRVTPWGTGQAILAARDCIREPFAVINADDYYGKGAFALLQDFLKDYSPERPADFCMAGFILKNTLSDHGTVTRGICEVGDDGYLKDIRETYNILKTPEDN